MFCQKLISWSLMASLGQCSGQSTIICVADLHSFRHSVLCIMFCRYFFLKVHNRNFLWPFISVGLFVRAKPVFRSHRCYSRAFDSLLLIWNVAAACLYIEEYHASSASVVLWSVWLLRGFQIRVLSCQFSNLFFFRSCNGKFFQSTLLRFY